MFQGIRPAFTFSAFRKEEEMTDILSLGASTIYMDIIIRVLLIIILILGIIYLVKLIFKK